MSILWTVISWALFLSIVAAVAGAAVGSVVEDRADRAAAALEEDRRAARAAARQEWTERLADSTTADREWLAFLDSRYGEFAHIESVVTLNP